MNTAAVANPLSSAEHPAAIEPLRLPEDRIGRRLQLSAYVSTGLNLLAIWGGAVFSLMGPAPAAGGVHGGTITLVDPPASTSVAHVVAPLHTAQKQQKSERVVRHEGTARRAGHRAVATNGTAGGGVSSTVASASAANAAASSAAATVASIPQPVVTPRGTAATASSAAAVVTPALPRLSGGASATGDPAVSLPGRAASTPLASASTLSGPMGAHRGSAGTTAAWRGSDAPHSVATSVTGDWATRAAGASDSAEPVRHGGGDSGSVAGTLAAPRMGGAGASSGDAVVLATPGTRGPLSNRGGFGGPSGPVRRGLLAGGVPNGGGERTAADNGPGGEGSLGASSVVRAAGGPVAQPGGSGEGRGDGIAAVGFGAVRSLTGGPGGIVHPGSRGNGEGPAVIGESAAPSGPAGRHLALGGGGPRESGDGGDPVPPGLGGSDRSGTGDNGGTPAKRPRRGDELGAQVAGETSARTEDGRKPDEATSSVKRDPSKPAQGETRKPALDDSMIGHRVYTEDVKVLRRVNPTIPEALRSETLAGTVRARFDVAASGSFSVRLVGSSGKEEMDAVIRAALNRWEFSPAVEDGKKIKSVYEVTIQLRTE